MAFGSIMRFKKGKYVIELAPLNRDVMEEFIKPGMQSASITKYLVTQAKVLEDEYEWYEKVRTDQTSLVWGIWIIRKDDSRELIGSSSLNNLDKDFFYSASTGSVIFKSDYWGKGIASAAHMARTWYAFHILGVDRIWSEVIQENVGSRRALERSGYRFTHVKRNDKFVDGKLRHTNQLECINPDASSWSRWWGSDRPDKSAREARQRTVDAMQWASNNVKLL